MSGASGSKDMMDVGHQCYKDTRCGASGPTVELVVDYDSAKRTKAPESPQNLVKDICKLGDEPGYILHSKDSGVTWDSLNYSVRYNESGANVLHMTIDISWPTAEAKDGYTCKMQDCVKECVSKAFGVHFGEHGTDGIDRKSVV